MAALASSVVESPEALKSDLFLVVQPFKTSVEGYSSVLSTASDAKCEIESAAAVLMGL